MSQTNVANANADRASGPAAPVSENGGGPQARPQAYPQAHPQAHPRAHPQADRAPQVEARVEATRVEARVEGKVEATRVEARVEARVETSGGTSPADGFASSIPGFAADARRRAALAEGFDLDHVIARYRAEHGFSREIADDHRREMLRFLALCATAAPHGKYYGMAGAIDELWHTFVIFTREYARFCEAVAGRFLHHVPDEGAISEATLDHYAAFLADYETVFGKPPPAAYWPRPTGLKAEAACKGCAACRGCTGNSCTVH